MDVSNRGQEDSRDAEGVAEQRRMVNQDLGHNCLPKTSSRLSHLTLPDSPEIVRQWPSHPENVHFRNAWRIRFFPIPS